MRLAILLVLTGFGIAHADERTDRAAAEQLCNAQDPACDWLGTLSSLERQTVTRAITKRGYTVEPSPWGKTIGKVHVYNEDVFAERSRVLQFFNNFHVTTKEFAIRLETVIGAGEVWDQERVEETARRLRDPLWSSVVVVIPVKSPEDGKVDMLVVTRDVWSLRLNTRYTFQEGKLTDLTLALSENNFFGTRKVLALAVDMDQGAIAMGPLFIDKNFLGQHVELRGRFDTVVNRDKFLDWLPLNWIRDDVGDGEVDYEGTQSNFSVTKPLWSLASKWGGGATFTHRFATDRRFFSTSIRPVRCPLDGSDCATRITAMPDEPGEFNPNESPAEELLPVEYSMRRYSTSVFATRQLDGSLLDTKLKQQLALQYSFSRIRPDLLDSFPGTPEQREPFRKAALPRRDTLSEIAVSYGFFTPKYRSLRNVQSYDLAEDVRFGPDFDVSVGLGLELLGGSANYQRAGTSLGWTFPWCRDGFVRANVGIGTKRQPGIRGDTNYIDNSASAGLRIVTPTYWFARVVASLQTATAWNRSVPGLPGPFFLGSDDGLRGYLINEFDGERLARGNLEIRSIPKPLWFLRVGAVIFYDAGAVPDTWKTFSVAEHYHHDIGLGFRALIPQSNREVFRFDLAFPLDNGARTKAGSPRFIASFEQFF